MKNKVIIKFDSKSENEQLARSCISAIMLPINPSVSELGDVKTAVSEAVTNAIVHGYPDSLGEVTMEIELTKEQIHIKVIDEGVGIENAEKALEPFYTTKAEQERAGMGFTIMKTFMDEFRVESVLNKGTCVYLTKKFHREK